MTDVRALLVGLAGMSLALAVGVIIGGGLLRGDAEQRLHTEIDQLEDERAALRSDRAARDELVDYSESFAAAVAPSLVADRLAGRQVVLVSLPATPEAYAEGLGRTIEAAGAVVTGTVSIAPKWAEPGEQAFLDDLAARLVTEDTILPEGGRAYDRAGAVLARALVTAEEAAAGTIDVATTGILEGFAAGDLLEATGTGEQELAELAVVLAPTPARAGTGEEGTENEAWLALARALDRTSRGVVVAGVPSPGAEDGAVDALRRDETARVEVSSVDVLNQASGWVIVVYALAEQFAGGVGHYGVAQGADGVLAPVG